MAPKKSRYNSALSREEEARRRLLENSSGEFDFSEEEVEPFVAERTQRFPEIDLTESVQEFPEIDISRPLIQAPEMDLAAALERKKNRASTRRLDATLQRARQAQAPIEDPALRSMVEGATNVAESYKLGKKDRFDSDRVYTDENDRLLEQQENLQEASDEKLRQRFLDRLKNTEDRAERDRLSEMYSSLADMRNRAIYPGKATLVYAPPQAEEDTAINRQMYEMFGSYPRMPIEIEGPPRISTESKRPDLLPYESPKGPFVAGQKAVMRPDGVPSPTDIIIGGNATPEEKARLQQEYVDNLRRERLLKPDNEALTLLSSPDAAVPSQQIPQPSAAIPQAGAPAVGPAAPVAAAKDVSPEQSRLEQLASILKMVGGTGETKGLDARQQALVDSIASARQAMYAGLTRSELPASAFASPASSKPEDQLSRLYKAAQIQQMLTPKGAELASDAAKQFLAKNAPELLAGIDVATLTQKDADRLMNLHAGGQKAKAQKELQDIRLKDANARAKERLDFARQQMDQRDFEFVTKQIATGTKQAQAAVRALPALEQLFNEQLELDVKGGADFLSRAGAGALNDAEQRKFDMLYERIIAEDRKRLFGATLTGNELETFNRISAQGPDVPMADKLEALRALMKGMQQELKAAFVPVEDKPAFLQFEARSGISHRNPMFTAFDETLRKRAAEMPRTGAGGLKEGVSNIFDQTGSFLDELFGPSPAPARAPAPAPAPNAAPPLPTQQEVVEPERPPAAQPKKPFRRVEYQGQKGWYDTEKGIFISDEEMKKMQSGTPSSLRMTPGR